MTMPRSMPHGTWSRTGARTSGRSCATTCRVRVLRRKFAIGKCSTSRANACGSAEAGLQRRQRLDHDGRDETRYLRPLQEFAARGITPAEELLEKYHGPWGKSVEPVFVEYAL